MIVILKPGAQKARVEALMTQIKQQGVDIHYSQGTTETILGLVGDTTHVDEDWPVSYTHLTLPTICSV